MRNHFRSLMRRVLLLSVLAGFIVAPAGFGQNSPAAEATNNFPVTPDAGPYLIIVTSYTGPEASKFAHDLCTEIRTRYKLPAYLYDWGAERRRAQDEELRQKREAQLKWFRERGVTVDQPLRVKKFHIEDEFAVFVGGYKDMETARKELDRIKKLDPPKSVKLSTINVVGGGDETDKSKKKEAKVEVNPFLQSFVVRNPLVKKDEAESEKTDPLLKDLNANEPYSVAQAKKPWTLVVKEFYGATVIQPQSAPEGLMKKLFGDKKRSLLEAGAHDAREIARGLRAMNIEAYVMHTRYGSIVTVGSYDSRDDPKLLRDQKAFAKLQLAPNLQLSMSPLPMKIPDLR